MKKIVFRNQEGFVGILPILLILLVIGLGGFAAWRYFDARDKSSGSQNDTNQQMSDEIPEGFVLYENKEAGLSFAYPEEWGEVKLIKQAKDELLSGKDYYLEFSNEKRMNATLRTPDWEPSGSRGSSTYDAPTSFDRNKLTQAKEWQENPDTDEDPDFITSLEVYLSKNELVITGECDAHATSTSLNAYAPLKKDFKVIRFYALFPNPSASDAFMDKNCDDIELIDARLYAQFLQFAETIKAI